MYKAKQYDFTIEQLGECKIPSPIQLSTVVGDACANYVRDTSFVRNRINVFSEDEPNSVDATNLLQKAGPREKIYFDPKKVKAGICTCGGLCPGLNDVIRAVVRCLWNRYGVRDILGFRYGYRGLFQDSGLEPIALNPDNVDEIHKIGGSFIGTSRGGGDRLPTDGVDTIARLGINMMFVIGGDGTQHGALTIAEEIQKRGLEIAVVGIPKTVDNDFLLIDRSFGFETAVQQAKEAIASMHMEARSQPNCISVVKLMGRESGFIAAQAALASHETNFCLIPEIPFDMEGPNGFLANLEKRLKDHKHAVVVVAEGAGQELFTSDGSTDASGNKKLADIGVYLRDEIKKYFAKKGIAIDLKYCDPSYQIRSAVTIASDSVYCERLGNNAVHAAMAGKTKCVVGLVHDKFVYIPTKMAIASRNFVDPEGALWRDALDATGQPILMVNDIEKAKKQMQEKLGF